MSKQSRERYYITRQMLEDQGACVPSQNEFRSLFGDKMLVNRANLRMLLRALARKGGLSSPDHIHAGNVDWPVRQLYYKASAGSQLERDAHELMRDERRYSRDPDTLVAYLNDQGDLWARYKAGER